MFVPVNLSIFYPHPGDQTSVMLGALCGFLLVVITALFVTVGKKYKYLIVGWLWFVGTLLPVSGLVQVGSHSMADRYTYIPLIGLFIAAVWAFDEILKVPKNKKQINMAVAGIVLVACVITTW